MLGGKMDRKVMVKNKTKQKTCFEAFTKVLAKDNNSMNSVLVEMGKPEQLGES